MHMTSHADKHVKALRLPYLQAPPMLSSNAHRSKSLASLPVSTAASTGELFKHPLVTQKPSVPPSLLSSTSIVYFQCPPLELPFAGCYCSVAAGCCRAGDLTSSAAYGAWPTLGNLLSRCISGNVGVTMAYRHRSERSFTPAGQEDLKRTATLPTERSFRSWFRGASARQPYTLVAV